MYPHKEDLPEAFFLKVPLCWGWATWKSSWSNYNDDPLNLWLRLAEQNALVEFDKFGHNFLSQQLAYNITGQLNTWFIKWHASVFLNSGYTLFPSKSLVNNIGFDDSGIHNKRHTQFLHDSLETTIKIERVEIAEHQRAASAITAFYRALRLSVNKPSLRQKLKQKTKRLAFKTFPVLRRTIPKPKFILNKSYLGKQVKLYVRARLNNSIVGSYTYVSENAIINNTVLGKFCSIGPNFISGWGLHPTKGISSHPMFYSNAKQNGMTLVTSNKFNETKSIQIGNDVFIGMNVVVLDGITIGNGAIIGAGSVVSKDIPPYAIAVGNPIKIIKYRFDEDIINKLLKIQWWNFNSDQLHLVEKYFYDIHNFIKACVNLQVEDKVKEKSNLNES
ncbi:MAG: CatB-related O-acetyltransferase [Winogradskyella sp.]|nr:CatB-related O-acetyltransferase [Winogradskyella sp.]